MTGGEGEGRQGGGKAVLTGRVEAVRRQRQFVVGGVRQGRGCVICACDVKKHQITSRHRPLCVIHAIHERKSFLISTRNITASKAVPSRLPRSCCQHIINLQAPHTSLTPSLKVQVTVAVVVVGGGDAGAMQSDKMQFHMLLRVTTVKAPLA